MLTKAEITLVKSLADKKGRREQGLFVVEGRKMVAEALASGFKVRQVYGTVDEVRGLAVKADAVSEVSPSQFERLSRLKAPQGVLALVEIPRTVARPVTSGLVIALDRVQDPGNLGTIVRVADWFGVRRVVCSPDSADIYNPKAIQATMGSLFRVAVHYTPLEEYLSGAGLPVYGAYMNGESIYGSGQVSDGILVMGNEGTGISPEVEKFITRRVSIPPYPAENNGAESLNVAVATAVIVSHFRGGTGR